MACPVAKVGAVALPLKFSPFRETVAKVEPMLKTQVVQLPFGGVAGSVSTHAEAQFMTIIFDTSLGRAV
jgi:hypothetical protein